MSSESHGRVQRLVGRLRDGDDLSSRIEAADELERQSAEIERLRDALNAINHQCEADAKAGEWTTSISGIQEFAQAARSS